MKLGLEYLFVPLLVTPHYIPEKSHILDIGCGSGIPIADYLIEKSFQVTGIDGSQELLNIAKKKCPKMRGLYGDIRTIKFNETVDAK